MCWYILRGLDELPTQGDLIEECPVPEIAFDYRKIQASQWRKHVSCSLRRATVVVLSQACDLVENPELNRRPDYAVVAPIFLLAGSKLEKAANEIKRYRKFRCYPLPSCRVDEKEVLPESVVDLTQLFTVPWELLKFLVAKKKSRFLSIRPPFREHLAWFMASSYSRFGLSDEAIASVFEGVRLTTELPPLTE